MNWEIAKAVADAVLYEGYMLYPYRHSAIKNRQLWSVGILYPPNYYEVTEGTERSVMLSECLIQAERDFTISVQVRFLHAVDQRPFPDNLGIEVGHPKKECKSEACSIGEAIERSTEFHAASRKGCEEFNFRFPEFSSEGSAKGALHSVPAQLIEVSGRVSIAYQPVADNLWKITLKLSNTTHISPDERGRDAVLLRSFVSAHAILSTETGQFLSLLEPPTDAEQAAASCRNVGNFPVLIGNSGERDMMLCSPILLYDYPQVAPESAGDFYDGTEMDEMLTLRIMTLTDEEKREAQAADSRVRTLIQRTEQSAREQLQRTHGLMRSTTPITRRA